jgi:hypothetical protein
MWQDAEIEDGHDVLEVGTGTGYSTALACERLGSQYVTSIEVDPHRLDQAALALYGLGYRPGLAVADGLFGYRPTAPFDRIVAACSVRQLPTAWLTQTRPGAKILTTLGGWLHGHARVLATVEGDGTASGALLPGTVSFMAARAQEPPAFGNPAHWAHLLGGTSRPARHSPERITAPGPRRRSSPASWSSAPSPTPNSASRAARCPWSTSSPVPSPSSPPRVKAGGCARAARAACGRRPRPSWTPTTPPTARPRRPSAWTSRPPHRSCGTRACPNSTSPAADTAKSRLGGRPSPEGAAGAPQVHPHSSNGYQGTHRRPLACSPRWTAAVSLAARRGSSAL